MGRQFKVGVTKSGIQENCEWEGAGPCPRHQVHSERMQAKPFGGAEDFVAGLKERASIQNEPISADAYAQYLENRDASRVGRYSHVELLGYGLTPSEIDLIKTTPPKDKEAEPVISQASLSGQLYNLIEEIHTENENSVNVDNMKEKYDGVRRIDNMDDARNAFLNEEANKIYNAAWLIESDPSRLAKYGEEIVDAANNVARLENNPTGTLPVNRTGDGYQLSPKYDKLLTLLKTHKNEIKKEAIVQGSYKGETPSFTLVNMRAEKAVIDKTIEKLEKSAWNPFAFRAKSQLDAARSIRASIEADLAYYESTNNDTPRTVI